MKGGWERCSARSRTAPQVGRSTQGEWRRPVFVLDGATWDPKTWILQSKCRVLGVPSAWPGKLQPRVGITIVLPAPSTKFRQKRTGKAAFPECLPLPFICSLSLRAWPRGMETPGPSCPPSAEACCRERCPFRREYPNHRAARLLWRVSCASRCNVAAVSS